MGRSQTINERNEKVRTRASLVRSKSPCIRPASLDDLKELLVGPIRPINMVLRLLKKLYFYIFQK